MKEWNEKLTEAQIDILLKSAIRRGTLRRRMENKQTSYSWMYEFERGFERGYMLALKMMDVITIDEFDEVMEAVISVATMAEKLDCTIQKNQDLLKNLFLNKN